MNKTCFCGIAEHCGYQIETDMKQHDKVIYEQGYNKAIDEFAERLKDDILGHFRLWGIIEEPTDYCDCIDEVAEKLKGRKKQ